MFPLNLTSTPSVNPENEAEWEEVTKNACPTLIGKENLESLHYAWDKLNYALLELSMSWIP